ncbi:hypothetical protein CFBP6411_03094 [Pseudomonas syringae group genomosp. 3]|uniref:Uncharacterized protein n=1 Tax=Pseudomonas syringae group genomosp. 3 TaxID=251701 RepID=A0A2K4WEZ6_9PSED|nr:hypothetical protein CFBP6411_03094 [Pseudomonas syringae group genomosp. 3]
MTQQKKAMALPKSEDILNWKIKTLARSPREMMITQSIFFAIYMIGSTLYMWGGWIMFSDSLYSLVGTILVCRLKINFSHACVLIAARARCILFKISSPLAFQT